MKTPNSALTNLTLEDATESIRFSSDEDDDDDDSSDRSYGSNDSNAVSIQSESENSPPPTAPNLHHLLSHLSTRVPWSYFTLIIDGFGLRPEIHLAVLAQMERRCLGACPVTGEMHTFHGRKKCIECVAQICVVRGVLFL